MMLALVNSERQRREELRMIIHPLSDDFINGSPEALPLESFRMQPYLQDTSNSCSITIKYQGQ
jgi:hypothetical protein